MSKKRLATTGIAIALASAVAMSPAVASPTQPEGAQVLSVSGVDISAWDVGAGVLDIVAGPKKCTVVANTPFQSANQVKGRGSVTCNNPYGLLTLEVCVQVKAAADANGFTWQNAGCQPLKAAKDATTLSDTATAPCASEAAAYRTFTHAQGFVDDDDTDPAFDAIIVSNSIAFNCGL
jgi:hypothetical protein